MKADTNKNTYYKQLASYYKNKARLSRCVAAVHVEANDDKIFWKKILDQYFPVRKFDFITYTRTRENNHATGCTTCLKYKDLGCLSKNFFICIDSDYRYIMQEKTINAEHFVLQTYTYSFENHFCLPHNVNNAFNKMGISSIEFDFDLFLKHYSQILYELFIYHLYSLSKRDGVLGKKLFSSFLNIQMVYLYKNGEKMLEELKDKVDAKLIELREHYNAADLSKVKRKCENLGITENNAYLYFRGHNVFEQVILKISKDIRRKSENELTKNFSDEEKTNYFSSRISTKDYLLEDVLFGEYAEINKIRKDIETLFRY